MTIKEKYNLADPETMTSLPVLQKEFEKVFLMVDKGVVKMVCSAVIANRLFLHNVWLMLVAPSSGGKTELIDAVSDVPYVHGISDLTVNTFASGLKRTAKETSLLNRIGNGLLSFKDFTSVLSKSRDAKKEIMGQLREIYDGHYRKSTGMGDDIEWKGRMGALAGSTEAIYEHLQEMSAMGDRFIMYNIAQPERRAVTRRALEISSDLNDLRVHLRACFKFFIDHVGEFIEDNDLEEVKISKETEEELLDVADFATKARSAVSTDFKTGQVTFVPSKEMPMRVTHQLFTLASTFLVINRAAPLAKDVPAVKGELTEEEKGFLYKTAFDSIPRTRRDVLECLASSRGLITTSGVATKLHLPTDSVQKNLAIIDALGLCKRTKKGKGPSDTWEIHERNRALIAKLGHIKIIDTDIDGEDDYDEDDDDEIWGKFAKPKKDKSKEITVGEIEEKLGRA